MAAMQRFAPCQLFTTGLTAGLAAELTGEPRMGLTVEFMLMIGRLIIGWHSTGFMAMAAPALTLAAAAPAAAVGPSLALAALLLAGQTEVAELAVDPVLAALCVRECARLAPAQSVVGRPHRWQLWRAEFGLPQHVAEEDHLSLCSGARLVLLAWVRTTLGRHHLGRRGSSSGEDALTRGLRGAVQGLRPGGWAGPGEPLPKEAIQGRAPSDRHFDERVFDINARLGKLERAVQGPP
eukprot:CAMPEP_0175201902 /NCGR_PEP_ID=MMETSP0093-20121207/10278_1 /TAXON_ID=311494 /ORGANISM="Alexandrium monilatum, Strain CCMP3105" /LENGTH=236 /DNA_ID=CAMNT_0016494933 /DNA_START=93 /DNA_END=802 /DNA_ORIENTATION=+